MNKYSKAVKTAATVGMSLAMVLSATAPVVNVNAASIESVTCEAQSLTNVANVYEAIYQALKLTEGAEIDYSALNNEEVEIFDEAVFTKIGTLVSDFKSVYGCTDGQTVTFTVKNYLGQNEKLVNVNLSDFADKLVSIYSALYGSTGTANGTDWKVVVKQGIFSTNTDQKGMFKSTDKSLNLLDLLSGEWKNGVTEGDEEQAIAYRDTLSTVVEEYAVNMTRDEEIIARDALAELEGLVSDFEEDYVTEGLDEYVKELTRKIEDAVDTGKFANEKVAIKKLINAIEKGFTGDYTIVEGVTTDVLNPTDARRYRNSDEVQEILSELDAMLEAVYEVEDAVSKTKNDIYADFIEGGSKSLKAKLAKLATKAGDYDNDDVPNTDADKLAYVADHLKLAEWEGLSTFKEGVIDVIWSFDSKEYTTRFVDKSGLTISAKETTVETALKDFDGSTVENRGFLLGNFDTEEGTWGWDTLAAHMDAVLENYTALTDGIKGLDAINVVATDKEAIMAADDALYFFEDGDYVGNLTAAQQKDVRDAKRKVNELMEAYRVKFGSLNVTTGWVNMGNGNWKFYEEDGTAPTKWIASGKDWFYVKDGAMLRNTWVAKDAKGDVWYYVGDNGAMVTNTTIDGCYINSLGVWTK